MFKLEDIIGIKSYSKFADHIYDAPNLDDVPDSGVVWMPMDQVGEFFKRVRGNNNRYILITSSSDYGLAYQVEQPPVNDLVKMVMTMAIALGPTIAYHNNTLPPPMKVEDCSIDDMFSVKMYRYTKCTFHTIPEEICHWFCANSMVNESRITTIPFGVLDDGREKKLANLPPKKKMHLLYVNFQPHTPERIKLLEFFKTQTWATVVTKEKPYDEYLEDLRNHYYVLCPPGNGIDSYRIWETIYAGSVPIVEANRNTQEFDSLPLFPLHDFYNITPQFLTESQNIYNGWSNFNLAKLTYWQNIIVRQKRRCRV